MKKIVTLIWFGCATLAMGQSYNGPESCEFDYANNRWLVGNKNSGEVLARSSAGTLSVFASGMTGGPYGIEILGNTLYCCHDGGKIRGFDLTTGAQVFNVNTGAAFLNGITSDGDSILYVTDFTNKAIYAVNVNNQAYGVVVSGLSKNPNGIVYDGANNRCIFVNWGSIAPISALNLADSSVTTLTSTSLNNCDGITRDGAGNYYVSAWGTQAIYRFNASFSGGPTLISAGMSNPADIFYNVLSDTLGIPNSGVANTLTFIGFGTVGAEEHAADMPEIYPNPADQECLVRSAEEVLGVELVDDLGRIVFCAEQLSVAAGEIYRLGTALLAPGHYTLRVHTVSGYSRGHLLVQH